MSLLIINADDFGYSPGINLGIVASHENGMLTSTTMMANMPGFEHGVELAKQHPNLGIGVHLTLTCGKPLLSGGTTLMENNEFRKISFYEKEFSIDTEELYKEWEAQIKKIIAAGIQPTHLDSHHHVNRISPMKEVFVELAQKYKLPVRNNFEVPKTLKTVNRFFTEFDSLSQSKEIWKEMTIQNLIQDCQEYGTVEVMCHPGYLDHIVVASSSLLDSRVFTVKELQNPRHKEVLEKNQVQFGTYRDL